MTMNTILPHYPDQAELGIEVEADLVHGVGIENPIVYVKRKMVIVIVMKSMSLMNLPTLISGSQSLIGGAASVNGRILDGDEIAIGVENLDPMSILLILATLRLNLLHLFPPGPLLVTYSLATMGRTLLAQRHATRSCCVDSMLSPARRESRITWTQLPLVSACQAPLQTSRQPMHLRAGAV
jgi:hypothetical protein